MRPRSCARPAPSLQDNAQRKRDVSLHQQRSNHTDPQIWGPSEAQQLEADYPARQHLQNTSQNIRWKNPSGPPEHR